MKLFPLLRKRLFPRTRSLSPLFFYLASYNAPHRIYMKEVNHLCPQKK